MTKLLVLLLVIGALVIGWVVLSPGTPILGTRALKSAGARALDSAVVAGRYSRDLATDTWAVSSSDAGARFLVVHMVIPQP